MQTYKDWPRELFLEIDRYTTQLRSYGFITDYDEVFEQLGMAVLVLMHKSSQYHARIDNLLGMTLVADLRDIPYQKRKEVLRYLLSLYRQYTVERRRQAEKQKKDHSQKAAGKERTNSKRKTNKESRGKSKTRKKAR